MKAAGQQEAILYQNYTISQWKHRVHCKTPGMLMHRRGGQMSTFCLLQLISLSAGLASGTIRSVKSSTTWDWIHHSSSFTYSWRSRDVSCNRLLLQSFNSFKLIVCLDKVHGSNFMNLKLKVRFSDCRLKSFIPILYRHQLNRGLDKIY